MLTLSVVIVPNQNLSPDHTIQSELLGLLTPVFWSILTQHLSGTEQINPNLLLLLCPDHPIRPIIIFPASIEIIDKLLMITDFMSSDE